MTKGRAARPIAERAALPIVECERGGQATELEVQQLGDDAESDDAEKPACP